MCDSIARILGSVDGLQVQWEVFIIPGGEHRADLKVSLHGTVHWVDIGITCPASLAMVDQRFYAFTSWRCGPAVLSEKTAQVCPVLNRVITGAVGEESLPGFVPFICETGGCIAKRTVK